MEERILKVCCGGVFHGQKQEYEAQVRAKRRGIIKTIGQQKAELDFFKRSLEIMPIDFSYHDND